MSTNQQLVTFDNMQLNSENPREREILIVEREFAVAQRKAKALASSNIVPKQFQNNVANCMIAMEMAHRLGTGDMEIMQNLYVVHGNPSFSSKYLIALVNRSGVIKGRLKFRFTGEVNSESWGCQAYAVCSETNEELSGTTITLDMAKKEGWSTKAGSKWATMPEQMLMYRAASFWSRIYAPDAIMDMHSREELEDIQEKDVTPRSEVSRASSIGSIAGGGQEAPANNDSLEDGEDLNVDTETGEIVDAGQSHEPTEETASAEGAFTQ